jgi:hypothetical protein
VHVVVLLIPKRHQESQTLVGSAGAEVLLAVGRDRPSVDGLEYQHDLSMVVNVFMEVYSVIGLVSIEKFRSFDGTQVFLQPFYQLEAFKVVVIENISCREKVLLL